MGRGLLSYHPCPKPDLFLPLLMYSLKFLGASNGLPILLLTPKGTSGQEWRADRGQIGYTRPGLYLSLGMIRMKRIMLMKMKQTMISIAQSSQLTDFCVCCSSRSDSVFSFSRFWSAILSECDRVCG